MTATSISSNQKDPDTEMDTSTSSSTSTPSTSSTTMKPTLDTQTTSPSVDSEYDDNDATKREFQPICYTDEELVVMREVRTCLMQQHDISPTHIGPRLLALTCLLNKNRVDEAVAGFLKLREAVQLVELENGLADPDVTCDIEPYLSKSYEPCGVDDEGRRIMWIRGKHAAAPEEEPAWVQAGLLYWMAIHADNRSLRQGIQFVIDVSNRPKDVYGNAAKLQKINQAFPLRPQAIYIAGTNVASRIVINGLIQVAALFAKAKVLRRIQFVSLDYVFQAFSTYDAPLYAGGQAGGIENVVDWVKERLQNFPVPDLEE